MPDLPARDLKIHPEGMEIVQSIHTALEFVAHALVMKLSAPLMTART